MILEMMVPLVRKLSPIDTLLCIFAIYPVLLFRYEDPCFHPGYSQKLIMIYLPEYKLL